MTAKKKHSSSGRGRSIWRILGLIPTVASLVRSTWHKLKVETCLALKNIIVLLMFSLMLACLLTATWISILAILFYTLLTLQWTWYAAAALIMSLNIIGILLLCISISRVKNKLPGEIK